MNNYKAFWVLFWVCFSGFIVGNKNEETLKLIKTIIPENSVIVEAGAHYGEDTKTMSELWPQGTIHAFEPLPNSFKRLIPWIEDCENVICYPYALSAKTGDSVFYVSTNNDGASSLLAPTSIITGSIKFTPDPITVKCTTLDEWAKQNSIDHVDFMWLDMEGHELDTLKASSHIFSKTIAVYTEVNRRRFREGTPLYEEVRDWFYLMGFYEKWCDVSAGWQGNVLYVRNGY